MYKSQAVQAQVLRCDAAVQTDENFPLFVQKYNRKVVVPTPMRILNGLTASTPNTSAVIHNFFSLCSSDEESEILRPAKKNACKFEKLQ